MANVEAAAEAPARPRRSNSFRLGVAVLIVGGATLLLRASPLLDAGVGELWGRLTLIQQAAAEARQSPATWSAFAEHARTELAAIAEDARLAHQRRTGPWKWLGGSDSREELALKEAQRIAESDIPALLASGTRGNVLRQRSVDEALARLDDHLAGASPYLPPLRPTENQAGLDDRTGQPLIPRSWLTAFFLVDLVLVAVAFRWWRSRRNG